MAKRKISKKQKFTQSYINRKGELVTVTGHKQIIWSEPRKILVGTYLTKKGKELLEEINSRNLPKAEKARCQKEINNKYLKNRYAVNPNAKVVKVIVHQAN